MQPKKDYIESAACSKLFSTLFYKKPCDEIIDLFKKNDFEGLWPNNSDQQKRTLQKLRSSVDNESVELIKLDFFRLFIGGDKKLAYPWGSVYTDKDNLIFGESSIKFKDFCRKKKISIHTEVNEPLDHIGIIFSVLSVLFERASDDYFVDDISELIGVHLLPWFYRFISLMQYSAETHFYQSISVLAEQYISYWESELEIEYHQVYLYK